MPMLANSKLAYVSLFRTFVRLSAIRAIYGELRYAKRKAYTQIRI